jgi:hypothetical protein
MDFCVASLGRVDPYAIWAQWPEAVKTIEDRRADLVDLNAGSRHSLQVSANMLCLGPRC